MNVFAFLEQNLQPTLEARRQRGEVFTPLELAAVGAVGFGVCGCSGFY